jgi:UDP-N-acetylmuramoyl-L-alanyl-D-glutamate--2,6-diaminopimelate ligase
MGRSASVRAEDIIFDAAHTEFTLRMPNRKAIIKSRLIGRHNVSNMLAAIAWGLESGFSLGVIKSAMEKFDHVPGRLEKIAVKGAPEVFVDYAHTEDALKNVITTLREVTDNKIIVVFGCGGERDKDKRHKMGRIVSELADFAIVTSDNPRSERPEAIIRQIEAGITGKNYCVIKDRSSAIKKALAVAGKDGIVLLAGKGHEDYQILKNKTVHFSDKETAYKHMRALKKQARGRG